MRSEGEIVWGVIVFTLAVAGVGGWIANIVKLAWSLNDALTAMTLLRIVGIPVAPLGAVLGYI